MKWSLTLLAMPGELKIDGEHFHLALTLSDFLLTALLVVAMMSLLTKKAIISKMLHMIRQEEKPQTTPKDTGDETGK